MTGNGEHTTGEILNLKSQVSELAQIPPWIERLASRFSIPESTQFAMNLCLEEVLSNVIWHGYSGQPDHSITVHFASPGEDYFVFVVEDQAPPFNPVESACRACRAASEPWKDVCFGLRCSCVSLREFTLNSESRSWMTPSAAGSSSSRRNPATAATSLCVLSLPTASPTMPSPNSLV
jgi:anti-sigma regulatory factor (Ser/Thr protein kinase)